jgi:hypothetical protein
LGALNSHLAINKETEIPKRIIVDTSLKIPRRRRDLQQGLSIRLVAARFHYSLSLDPQKRISAKRHFIQREFYGSGKSPAETLFILQLMTMVELSSRP